MNRSSIGVAAAIASLALASCRDIQSALAPQGPQAMQIAQLAGLLFAGGAAILVIVVAALVLAMRGPAQVRTLLAREGTVILAGIAFPVTVLTALLGYSMWLMRTAIITGPADRDAVPVEVVGEQWWWRLGYVEAGGRSIASANEVRIPAGQDVELTLKSADVIHSFWIPALAGKVDMIPGRTTRLRLRADRAGIFRGQCAEYCGGPHALMAVEVIAMPSADFAAWLRSEGAPAAEPANDKDRRGKALFLAAGCGACHAVRGTQAIGTIGPDLTHIGARRSVGGDMLPMTQSNLARFVVDGQHLKPGNNMPPFRIFSDEELDALSGYLVNLK
jgi:cytochrome c oxidase subunit 2